MQPYIVTKDEIKLIGLETRTLNRHEMDPATAKIPKLWKQFSTEELADKIPSRTDVDTLFGTYTNYASDHTDEYSLIVGAKVNSLDEIPQGMTGLTITPARYMVFPVEGEMPQALGEAWGYIWRYFGNGTAYERSYTADFELYDLNNPTKVDIYIAIK
jgi:predicted transcriptional regulator YdeE